LQTQLDTFTGICNQIRAHRALHGATPANAYLATVSRPSGPTSQSALSRPPRPRDRLGKISLRRAGRMHHLGVGPGHAGSAVTILIDPDTVTVIHRHTGEVLSEHTPSTPAAATGATNTQTRPMATANKNDDPTQI
jgi:hypothetical protein